MARGRKHQPSSIDRLPEEIRDAIAGLRREGRTVDDIKAHLDQLKDQGAIPEAPSRSAVGRHIKTMAEIGEEMRRADNMARFVAKEFGQDADDRVGRANMRILQGAILELITERDLDEDGQPVRLSTKEAGSLALSLQRLISAQSMDAERQLKLRREFAAEAAKVAGVAARSQGLTLDTVKAIEHAVLGLAT